MTDKPQRGDAPEPAKTKPVNLTLSYFRLTNAYEVKQIVNSTWYKPGDWLSEDVVKRVCSNAYPNWTVVMNEPDFNIPFLPIQLPK